ncbi:phosphonate ABC transporter ATP-binding protein [Paenibacillus kribbensis]|uniref:Phosphonate ABC transporter ATP-binding protein n=1 Tax=Paenibacillus kribbensis TaxID=172713 RepID=A0A222WNB9_9BACL|nr:phosphonate ABC transporter ATP-binding protein [Paenibacillus kribbensis]ASR47462.1 phosphonate ABC transporter ATP-binding protein [Paenibacillus kribbensis]
MIKVEDLVKSYGQETILNNINCSFESNDAVVLLGPSGAGKSTLLRCLNGLIEATSGSIYIDGKKLPTDKKGIRLLRKNIGMIFQNFNLVKRLTVLDNVLCGRLSYNPTLPSFFKVYKKEDYELALYYLEKVGLVDKRNQRADNLSGGQMQRVAIARALVQRPTLLLADEPVASLDPKTSHAIMDLLMEVYEEEKLTMIITLHQIDLAPKYSKRILGLNSGNIVADYRSDQVKASDLYQLYENGQETGEDRVYKYEEQRHDR